MKVAVWNMPPVDLLTAGMTSGEYSNHFEVLKLGVGDCERVLREGHVDIALLPILSVLEGHKELEVAPAVAFSTWQYPFARLVVDHDLASTVREVAYNPIYEHERFVAEVILREHYRLEPEFTPIERASCEELLSGEQDASLLVGPGVPTMALEGRVLDLGREWFELANYPMTWGLFAARKGRLDEDAIRILRDAVRASEERRMVWLRAQETSEELFEFYADGMRFRLDDLCVAGLSEFRQFLFYYDVLDDVRDIPFVFLTDEEEEDQGRKPLL